MGQSEEQWRSARVHTSWVDERKEWLRSMVRVWCMNYKGLDKERGSAWGKIGILGFVEGHAAAEILRCNGRSCSFIVLSVWPWIWSFASDTHADHAMDWIVAETSDAIDRLIYCVWQGARSRAQIVRWDRPVSRIICRQSIFMWSAENKRRRE